MKFKFAASVALALAFAAPLSAAADSFTPEQKTELGAFVRDYLINNPEVLRDAINALDKHDKQVVADAQKKIVTDQSGPLFSSPFQAVIGNPKGAVTIVEFFDYNCHYCKGALPDMAKLVHDDPNLKLILKDFPVLGPGSVEAARVASAARNQLPGDKFWDYHYKLLNMHGAIGKEQALAVAKDMGLDMAKLQKDMEAPEIATGIHQVMDLADSLQINGTPSFVVGDQVVVGAVGYDQLHEKAEAVHKCGHATC